MSSIDLYDVLDLEPECSKQDIIKSYRKLVKKYHPDKPTGDPDLFELINLAFDTLSNSKKRKEYDALKKLSDDSSKNHVQRLEEFEQYVKLQDGTKNEHTEKQAKIEFKDAWNAMDAKHKFIRSDDNMDKIKEKDAIQMAEDLETVRKDDYTETLPERIFDEGNFDLKKFNEAFELMHANGELTDLIKHQGMPNAMAFNDGVYSSYESNYGDLYVDNPDDDKYGLEGNNMGSINNGVQTKTMSAKDVLKLKGKSEVYDYNKEKTDENYKKQLEDMMKNLQKEREKDLNMQMKEYSTDPNMGGYGFLNEIDENATSNITWDNEESLKIRYEKLLKEREKN